MPLSHRGPAQQSNRAFVYRYIVIAHTGQYFQISVRSEGCPLMVKHGPSWYHANSIHVSVFTSYVGIYTASGVRHRRSSNEIMRCSIFRQWSEDWLSQMAAVLFFLPHPTRASQRSRFSGRARVPNFLRKPKGGEPERLGNDAESLNGCVSPQLLGARTASFALCLAGQEGALDQKKDLGSFVVYLTRDLLQTHNSQDHPDEVNLTCSTICGSV
ncbi:hypothetical protein BC835DRAFT_39019 [Cytidiella melzeri]|nr:hypothetical protein BC835DRAFT_39019 [Cytidiella melzeri]